MPTLTERLSIPKPAGNESVTRENFNNILDVIDENAASEADVSAHLVAEAPHAGHVTILDFAQYKRNMEVRRMMGGL